MIRGLRQLDAYLRVVEAALPQVLLVENVKGLASGHRESDGVQLLRRSTASVPSTSRRLRVSTLANVRAPKPLRNSVHAPAPKT